MLPEASMVFLDEIFNANSAILNSLLMALNERTFRRGKESRQLPVLMFVGASNLLPEDETLNALLDRFLIRIKCDYVDPDSLHEVLLAGWELERSGLKNHSIIPADEVRQVQQAARRVDLNAVRKPFVGLVHGLRNAGIKVSDRRAVKIQNLIAASAFVCGRSEATLSDLWVLKYIWDTEEQIEIIAGMVDRVIEKEPQETAHAQAFANRIPNAEELAKEVSHLKARWQTNALTLEEQNILKDKLRYVQTRSSWVRNQEHKQHIQTEIDALWHSMLQSL
jgi:MoxR-like ATPase